MNMMKRQIKLPAEVSQRLRSELGMSESYFSHALRFTRHSEDCQRARKLALERGGVVYCSIPECETIHDANGMMVQTFANGAKLIADKVTGKVRIELRGELVSEHYHVSIAEVKRLQQIASDL